ncbi:quercetin dioxygenase-like cupin family protein [Flavobacterium sp. 28YEA47A]|uniref:cupin domain-containing protein n=1 Tax=Flavobacterium sp. 28YEA47A TaxID=3156276 RepID=UPI003514F76D
MKHTIKCLLVFAIFLFQACSNNQKMEDTKQQNALIFPKGEKITNGNFIGDVWLSALVQPDSLNQNAIGSVTFEPGTRTKWHSHPAGQIILALEGEGYYQEKGSPKVIVRKGDAVKCPPDIPHWHGASVNSTFIQLAITGREKGETIWLEAVTDEEYNGGLK